jgi:hypothetical protein
MRIIPNQKYTVNFCSWLGCYFSRHIGCKSINFAMYKIDILMIRIWIIGSNTKKNNKEYVDFIVCKRIISVNIINRNIMQLCVIYVQVRVYFPVLVKLIQSLLHRQKSQFFRHYITSRHHTILTRLFFKMFLLIVWNFVNVFVVAVQLWLRWVIQMNTYINFVHQLTYFMKIIYSLFYNIIHDMATTINMHTII